MKYLCARGLKLSSRVLAVLLPAALIISPIALDRGVSAASSEGAIINDNGAGSFKALESATPNDLEEEGVYPTLAEAMQAARYGIYRNSRIERESGSQFSSARNPRHGFRAEFGADGLLLSGVRSEKWHVRTKFVSYGRAGSMQDVERRGERIGKDNRKIHIDYTVPGSGKGLVEWFINGVDGLEQGWNLEHKPEGNGDLVIAIDYTGTLAADVAKDRKSVTFRNDDGDPVIRYERPSSWDLNGKRLETRIEQEGRRLKVVVDDSNAQYPVTVDPYFTEASKLTASDTAAGDQFGWAVSVNGDSAVVGAWGDDDAGGSSGSAYVFTRNSDGMGGVAADAWGEVQKLTASDASAGDAFGYAVSISGDTIAVGAPGDSDAGASSGSVYLFSRNSDGMGGTSGDNWGEIGKLTASDAAGSDFFGIAVAISGDKVIAGSPGDDDGGGTSGSAYVFSRNEGGIADSWGETQKLTASDAAGGDQFGLAVSISGDRALVGSPFDDDDGTSSGSAYLFERNSDGMGGTLSDNWGEEVKITASDGAGGDQFGFSVSISGETAAVGAWGNSDAGGASGSAYVFGRNSDGMGGTSADAWGEVDKLTSNDAAAGDNLGYSVSISGDTVVAGARNDADAGAGSGSVYVFARNQGGTADSWDQAQKLEASDAAMGDVFGSAVSISGDTVLVGAPNDDDGGADSGSAYSFQDVEGIWTETAKSIASDPAATDGFGSSVSISGDTAVAGAPLDDDSGADSGSAYVFKRNTGGADGWAQADKLTASDAGAGDNFGTSVSVNVDTIVVGSPLDDDAGADSGSAYIFKRNEGGAESWGEVEKLTATDAASDDQFGSSVSVSTDTVAVGAFGNSDAGSESGSAYVFARNAGGTDNWGEVQKLTASDAAADDQFGISVSVSGGTIVVGSHFDDDSGSESGSAYVFLRNQGGVDNWGELQKLTASDAAATDNFGRSVSISGDTLVVGAHLDDDTASESGSAYVFTRNEGGVDNWGQLQKLVASDAAMDDNFGYSVSISGDTVVVGAYGNDDAGAESGSAYVFARNLGSVADSWGQQAKLTASDAAAGDEFGTAVSVSGDVAFVGASNGDTPGPLAPLRDSGLSKTGKDAGPSPEAADSGAAYVFTVGLPFTAADVSIRGRITDGRRGIPNAVVSLREQSGDLRVTRTNRFGYFNFDEIEAGQTLIISAYSKGYVFPVQALTLNADVGGLEIVGKRN
ncbi:MAG: hypothetical protein DWQ47_12560 [Acidobacteria bacterium]|nr:MAG: hypothetical protein DWQ32_14975 [Acidobacteriota bacterium]REJ98399.1 MAG: hypothetical protein DWQ38_17775 [Acidobacteriota bacterium]REK17143.1 MAG: hypothetical protein DWQ43_02820 [Acidobacteriota bacterium]REK43053.1 MAG: hypothetical protein DWQ47_12560 [Acidobacteriota bacterium]